MVYNPFSTDTCLLLFLLIARPRGMEPTRVATLQVLVSILIIMDPNNADMVIPKSKGYRLKKYSQLDVSEKQLTSGFNLRGTGAPITTEAIIEGRLTQSANKSEIEGSAPISNLTSETVGQNVVEGTSPMSIVGKEDINYMQYSLTLTRKADDSPTFGFHFDGTKVAMITKNSPAGQTGMVQLGDEILKVNDVKIASTGDIFDVLGKSPLSIDITLQRPLPRAEETSNSATDNILPEEEAGTNVTNEGTTVNNFIKRSFKPFGSNTLSTLQTSNTKFLNHLDGKSSYPNVTVDDSYNSGLNSTVSAPVEIDTLFDSNDTTENNTSLQDNVQHPTIESWALITDISRVADVKNRNYTTASDFGSTENYEDKIENNSMTDPHNHNDTSVTEMSEIPLTTMECCKLSNVPVICHGLCTPAIAMGRSVHEKGLKRLNTCSQYTDIIDKCFSIPNNHVENSSCTCKDMKNRNNVGNCEGERPTQFNTTTACYVNLPSTCSDLKESITNPGEMLSIEACNFNEVGEVENYNRSTLSNNETYGITESSLNSDVSRNESDSRNMDIEQGTKNSSDRNPELTKLTTTSYYYTNVNNMSEEETFSTSKQLRNETYGVTESILNLDVTGNNSDSRNTDIDNESRNNSDENPASTEMITLSPQFSSVTSNERRNSSLKENVTNSHSNFVSFWQQYRKRFLKVLQRSKYELNDAPVRFFVRRQSFPRDSIKDFMYPEINSLAKEFKQCVLYRQCLPMEKGKNNILNDTSHTNKESCLDENESEVCPNNTIKFELSVTGWGPGQYAPIHDHSREGSLMNIIKGPGLLESIFWKPPESEIEDYNPSYEQELKRDYTFEDNTQFYSCFSFLQDQISNGDEDGCEYKNQTTAYITKNKSYNLTRGKMYQIRFYKGFNRLIALKNMDKNETTLTLHHTLGHNRVSWWLNNQNDAKLFE